MIIIKPFIQLIEILLSFNYSLTGNYGISLILLSFEITVIMLPFYYLAEKWKRAEEKDQFNMEKDINSIKAVYTGQKRFYLINEVHRIHNYKSVYSLRVTFGLILQIPLFMAAYICLSHYTELNGISFSFFPDLGKQDQLIFGINVLPFIMTIVNIFASFMYAKESKRSDKVQLVIMALLFLVLLYDRPAGLVFYWTMNNVFSIPKNIWLKKVCPPVAVYNEDKIDIREIVKSRWTSTVIWISALFILLIQSFFLDKKIDCAKEMVLAAGAFGAVLFLVFFIKWIKLLLIKKTSFNYIILPLLCWSGFMLVGVDKFINGPLSTGYEVAPLWLFMFFMQMIINAYSVHFVLKSEDFPCKMKKENIPVQDRNIYIISSGFLCLFFFLFSPVITFFNGGSVLRNSLSDIVLRNIPLLVLTFVFSIIIYFVFRKKRQNLIRISVLAVFMTLLYFYVLPCEGGGLNFNFLMDEKAVKEVPFIFYFLDFFIIASLYLIASFLKDRFRFQLTVLLVSFFIGIGGEFMWKIISTDSDSSDIAQNSSILPEESDIVHSFSKTGKNIFLIVPDMFLGGYMKDIEVDNPEIINNLNGFTWYPNTLSISTRTCTSMPSILGGRDYTPDGLNYNENEYNDKKSNDAYYEIIIPLAENGWNVSFSDPYISLKGEKKDLVTETRSEYYMPYWSKLNNNDVPDLNQNNSLLLSMFSVFHSAPYSFKKTIYSKGLWLFSSRDESQKNVAIENQIMWSYLDLIPRISNTDSEKSTFKYIHTELTHHPFAVDKSGKIVYDRYPDEEAQSNVYGRSAYYSAREFLRLLSDFVTWLKSEGIYDNTMIIVVSDHGNSVTDDDPYLNDDLRIKVGNNMFSLLHPLLMVKDFNSKEDFQLDPSFMTNADVSSIIASEIDFVDEEKLKIERPLKGSNPFGKYRHFYNFKVCEYDQWEVHDSIFEADHWERVN